jgi:hypothetical protein
MRTIIIASTLLLVFVSCTKEKNRPVYQPSIPPAHPVMYYTDLHNAEVKRGQSVRLDANGDGTIDFSFGTMLVGDPIMQQDKLQFLAYSGISNYLLNGAGEITLPVNKPDSILQQNPGFEWYEISAIVLVQKVTGVTGSPWYEGQWKNASHLYLPLQIRKNGQQYLGWVETSFDQQNDKLIVHRAAMSTEPGRNISAGY